MLIHLLKNVNAERMILVLHVELDESCPFHMFFDKFNRQSFVKDIQLFHCGYWVQ